MKKEQLDLLKKINTLQKKIGKIVKDSENPYFQSKYTDVNSLIEQLEPLLEERNLMLIQPIEESGISGISGDKVNSKIIDLETGEIISSAITLPAITDPQKIGSAITYFRRYTLTTLLALQSEDDDGNLGSGKQPKKEVKMVTRAQAKLLQKLGYKGEIRGMTSVEADKQIKLLTGKQK